MRTPAILIAIIVGLIVAFVGYSYLNQERPMSERLGDGLDQAANGNFGEAADEVGNRTVGDKLQDDVNDITAPVTTPPAAPSN